MNRLFLAVKRLTCRHKFRGIDMGPRVDGLLQWPCAKCGKVFRMEYGLQAPGEITGPWGIGQGKESSNG